MYDFKPLQQKVSNTAEWLANELSSIQTGRATPTMLDSIKVDSYGSKVSIKEVASITSEDARTLRIAPWDNDSIRSIEVAIRDADLGLGVSVDDQGVRVSFPELTGETREKYIKLVHQKKEEAHVSIRQERDDVWGAIQKQEKAGEIGKDEMFGYKEEMEKIIKNANGQLEELATKKEREVRS